jgi:hypothetical protein
MKSPCLGLALVVACGSEGAPPPSPPAPPATALSADAGVAIDAGITELPSYDPASGFALDPDPVPRPGGRAPRSRGSVQLLLRSTPSGALAIVDGVRVGVTPVLWDGDAGIPHEFTFGKAGHSSARYRFVPLTSGVVHGRLYKVTTETPLPPLPVVEPPAAAPRPVAPPRPIDAAPSVDAEVPTDAGPIPLDVDAI